MLLERCLCGDSGGEIETHNLVNVVRCPCGVARLIAEKDEYASQYDDGSYHTSSDRHPGCVPYEERYANDYRVAKLRADRYQSNVNSYWTPGMLALDVGCANGAFVHYLRTVGIRAIGLDRKSELPHGCIRGDVQSIRLPMRFGLVTYHDVLEHIVDPLQELRSVRRLMADKSALVLDVPDVAVPQGQHHWKAEHLWYFTAAALRGLLEHSGFTVGHEDRPIPGKLVVYGFAA